MVASNQQSKQISPFVDMLCARCPSVNFVKVKCKNARTMYHFIYLVPSIPVTEILHLVCCILMDQYIMKVDMDETPAVAEVENVRVVPTFKIYKNGTQMKELICPSQEVLEHSVRHYSF